MKKNFLLMLCLLLGIAGSAMAKVQLGPEKVLNPTDDFSNKEIAIRAAYGKCNWVKIGSVSVDNLEEDQVFILESSGNGSYYLKNKISKQYLKKGSGNDQTIQWTANVDESAIFTVEKYDNADASVPDGVNKDKVVRLKTTLTDESTSYFNHGGDYQKPKFFNGRGNWSALLIYDAKDAFKIEKVYKLSFRPISNLSDLTVGKKVVIRNCFVDGEKGDRSGYIHMTSPKMTITKGMNTVTENSVFTVNTKEEGEQTGFSFQYGSSYIPNDGGLGSTLAPSLEEKFYDIIPVENNESMFNFKSSDKELYMNANVGELVFWNATPHPYQIYAVEEITDFEAKTVNLKYVDANSNVEIKTVEKTYYTNTYPVVQDLQADLPAGFEMITVDGTAISEVQELAVVSNEKTSYTIAIQRSISLTDAEYGTLYSDVALSIPEGITAYTGVIEGEKLKLSALSGIIPANTAVVLKGNAGEYVFQASAEPGVRPEKNDLMGSLSNILKPTQNSEGLAATVYTLQNLDNGIGFYKYTGTHMQPCKAYLMLDEVQAQNVRSLVFDTEGTTAIENISISPTGKAQLYDLQGRKINQVKQAGIYILNGKKVWLER